MTKTTLAFTATFSFLVGVAVGYKAPVPTTPQRVKLKQLDSYDLRLYDVVWQVEGDRQFIGLCRGPMIDNDLLVITCLMPKGTTAPWIRPSSESVEPAKAFALARVE